MKKVSHHTSPPTARELAYLEHGDNPQHQVTPSSSLWNKKSQDSSSHFRDEHHSTACPGLCTENTISYGMAKGEFGTQTYRYKDDAHLGPAHQPKMRVVQPHRGAHHMYSTAGSSSSSLSSTVSDPQRGSTTSHVRKRNYIIFDENDEDTLI